ncbi:MAG: hypothetical protein ACREJU_06330 [Nitrospiraceae bacterium]
MNNEDKSKRLSTGKPWVRIPNGTKVSLKGVEGSIDGLTEIVSGSNLNPDGKTQYRISIGAPIRELAAESDLLILTDQDGLVLMAKEQKASVDYRRHVTEQLHGVFDQTRFVIIQPLETQSRGRGADLAHK